MPLVTSVADRMIAPIGAVLPRVSAEVLAHPDVVASYLGNQDVTPARGRERRETASQLHRGTGVETQNNAPERTSG